MFTIPFKSFGDYGGSNDSVVARLEFAMPTDAEEKLQGLHRALESVKTTLQSTNRFTKEFVDYLDELPEIQKKVEQLHDTHKQGLEESTKAYEQATDAADGDKRVSTPINGVRRAGEGAGQPAIAQSTPAPVATAAHEHLSPDDLVKPQTTVTPIQDSDPPPAARPHDMSSDRPAPAQYQQPSSAPPPPSYSTYAQGAPAPVAQGTDFRSAPPSPVSGPSIHTTAAPAPVVGQTPAVHIPSAAETSFSSSAPPPVSRPPSPIPVSEQSVRPSVPIPVTDHSVPVHDQPILPISEFGTSVPPPPSVAAEVANLSLPAANAPVLPHAQAPTTARFHPLTGRPLSPIESHAISESRPAHQAPHYSPADSYGSSSGEGDRGGTGRGGSTPSLPARAATEYPHSVSPPHDSREHLTSRAGHGPALPPTFTVGSPPPIPGHERIQHYQDSQSVPPHDNGGGAPPPIPPHLGGPSATPGEPSRGGGGNGGTVIHANTVNITTGAPAHVQAQQSHIKTPQSTVHTEQAHVQSPQSHVHTTQTHVQSAQSHVATVPLHQTTGQEYTHATGITPETHGVHETPGSPVVGGARADGSRVIGHIPPATRSAPQTGQTTTTPGQKAQHQTPTTGKPEGTSPSSTADYRQKLGQQLKGKPQEIFDRLHQRGLVTETVHGDQKKYQIHLGNKSVTPDEFMGDEKLQDEGIDHLAQEASPQGAENGNPIRRVMHAGGILRNIGRTVKGGGDASGAMGELGDVVSSMGKGGGAMEGLGGAIGGAARFAGPVGLAVGGALAVNSAVQKGGEKVQGLYNEGTIRGGGTWEGAKTEGSIAAMALNPFISNEQSRQIIMASLNTGAQGGQYDNVTNFMKDNLTKLNVSVADSAKMLDKNVKDGGISVANLSSQLETLKGAAQTGSQTLPQLAATFQQRSGELVDAGQGGRTAGVSASQEALTFNQSGANGQPNPLAGKWGKATSQMGQSQTFMSVVQQQAGQTGDPLGAQRRLGSNLNESMLNTMKTYVDQVKGTPDAPETLMRIMGSMGVQITDSDAQHYIDQLGGSPTAAHDAATQADQQRKDQQGNKTEAHPMGRGVSQFAAIGSHVAGVWDELTGDSLSAEKEAGSTAARTGTYSNQALEKVVSQHGMGNTVVYDPQGKPHKVDFNDKTQMEGLEHGDWQVAATDDQKQQDALGGGDWQKTAEGMRGSAGNLTDVASAGGSDDGGDGAGKFDLTPQAAQLLKLIPGANTQSDSNTLNSNTGSGGSTRNNPAPGNAGTPYSVPSG